MLSITSSEGCHSSSIGNLCKIESSSIESSEIRDRVHIGPYSHIRSGTVIEDEEEEITGKATIALWEYALLASKTLICGLVDYKWRHQGEFLCVTRKIGKILVVVYPALIHIFSKISQLQDGNLKMA